MIILSYGNNLANAIVILQFFISLLKAITNHTPRTPIHYTPINYFSWTNVIDTVSSGSKLTLTIFQTWYQGSVSINRNNFHVHSIQVHSDNTYIPYDYLLNTYVTLATGCRLLFHFFPSYYHWTRLLFLRNDVRLYHK